MKLSVSKIMAAFLPAHDINSKIIRFSAWKNLFFYSLVWIALFALPGLAQWSSSTILSTSTDKSVIDFDFAANPASGIGFAVISQKMATTGEIAFVLNRYDPVTGWNSSGGYIINGTGTPSTRPRIIHVGKGKFLMTYSMSRKLSGTYYKRIYSRFFDESATVLLSGDTIRVDGLTNTDYYNADSASIAAIPGDTAAICVYKRPISGSSVSLAYARRWSSNSMSWGAEKLLSTNTTDSVQTPRVAVSNDGKIFVTFIHHKYPSFYYWYYSTSTNGTTWSTTYDMYTESVVNASGLAAGSTGMAVFVYGVTTPFSSGYVYSSGSWGSTHSFDTKTGSMMLDPHIVYFKDKKFGVVYTYGTNYAIKAALYTGTAWSPSSTETLVDETNNPFYKPSLFYNPATDSMLIAYSGNGAIRTKEYPTNGSWTGVSDIVESTPSITMNAPKLFSNGRGRLFCLYLRNNGSVDQLAVRYKTIGSGVARYWRGSTTAWSNAANWSPAGVPSTEDTVYFDGGSSTACVLDADGQAASLKSSGYTGTLNFNGKKLSITGSATLSGIAIITPAAGILEFTGSSVAHTLSTKANETLPAILYNSTTLLTCSSTSLTIDSLILNQGSFTASSSAISITGSLKINGSAAFSGATGRITVGGDVIMQSSSASLTASSDSLIIGGSLLNSGNAAIVIPKPGQIIMTSSTAQTITSGGATLRKLILRGNGSWRLSNNTAIDSLVISNGTLHLGSSLVHTIAKIYSTAAPGGVIDFDTALVKISDTADFSKISSIIANRGKLEFVGSTAQQLLQTRPALQLPDITHAVVTSLAIPDSTLQCNNFTQSAGQLDLTVPKITITGNLLISNGTATTLKRFTVDTIRVSGSVDMSGSGGADTLRMERSVDWYLQAAGTVTASYSALAHCNSAGYTRGLANFSRDLGSNTNWDFNDPPIIAAPYPIVDSLTTSRVVFSLASSKNGSGYCVITDDTLPAPTSAQVKAGKNGRGVAVGSGLFKTFAVLEMQTVQQGFSNLSPGNPYKAYVVMENSFGTLQLTPAIVSFQPVDIPLLLDSIVYYSASNRLFLHWSKALTGSDVNRSVMLKAQASSHTLTAPHAFTLDGAKAVLQLSAPDATTLESWPPEDLLGSLLADIQDSLLQSGSTMSGQINGAAVRFDASGNDTLGLQTASYDADGNELTITFNKTITGVDSMQTIAFSADDGGVQTIMLAAPWSWHTGESNTTVHIPVSPNQAMELESYIAAAPVKVSLASNIFFSQNFGNLAVSYVNAIAMTVSADTTRPSPVSGLCATAVNCSTVVLFWTRSSSTDNDSVRICASYDSMPQSPNLGTYRSMVGATATSSMMRHPSPSAGKLWIALFTRDNAGNWSPYNTQASTSIGLIDATPPANLVTLTLQNLGDSLIAVSVDVPQTNFDEKGIYFDLRSGSPYLDRTEAMELPYSDTTFIAAKKLIKGEWFGVWAPFDSAGNVGQVLDAHVMIANQPPHFIIDTAFTLSADSPWILSAIAYDIHNDPITLTVLSAPTGLTALSAPATLQWQPTKEQIGSYTVSCIATDSDGASDTTRVNLTVQTTNHTPMISSITCADSVNQGGSVQGSIMVCDPDEAEVMTMQLYFEQKWSPLTAVSTPNDSQWIFTFNLQPADNDTGYRNLFFHVADKRGASTMVIDTIFVAPRYVTMLRSRTSHYGAVRLTVASNAAASHSQSFSGKLLGSDLRVIQEMSSDSGIFLFYPLRDGTYYFSGQAENLTKATLADKVFDTITIVGASTHTWHAAAGWQMVSIPTDTPDIKPLIAVGTLLRWDESAPRRDLYEYYTDAAQRQENQEGASYWFKFTKADSLAITLNEEQLSTATTSLSLHKTTVGWNQIASPYIYPIQIDNARNLWQWNEKTRDFERAADGILFPWTGYWILTEAPDTLLLVPKPTLLAAEETLLARRTTENFSDHQWYGRLVLRSSVNQDADNLFGVMAQTQERSDITTTPEPPSLGNEPRLYFLRENEEATLQRVAYDIRAPHGDPFTVYRVGVSAANPQIGRLNLFTEGIPAQFPIDIFVATPNGIQRYDTIAGLQLTASSQEQFITLIASSQHGAEKLFPLQFACGKPYPNPLQRHLTLNYTIPYRWSANGLLLDNAYDVKIRLFDARGRRVAELLNARQKPGSYVAGWNRSHYDGKEMCSGVYFISISAPPYSAVRQAIVVR
ncbi:MAG: hypothetical protein JW795_13210 [Chitinivibrionales bacterium]|nr:hypothetical protein [Chitinivibrionales bacterium]